MANFNSVWDKINQGFNSAKNTNSEESYEKLADIFGSLEGLLRETIQKLTREDISKAVENLEAGADISPADLAAIKLWIVGDADYYVKREDDYKDAMLELNKIIEQIGQLKDANVDVENSAKLRAILEDGSRVIYNIAFYLEKKERLQKFESAVPDLDEDGRKLLIDVLKDKLDSNEE